MKGHVLVRLFLALQLLVFFNHEALGYRCDRKPYGITTQASAADGRFQLSVLGVEDVYVPEQRYTVQISETDGVSRFISFVISAESDMKPDPRFPWRLVSQYPGELLPMDSNSKYSDRCLYAIEQTENNFKSSTQAHWQTPPAGNGCITLRAMVAESDEEWYEGGNSLTVKICEDTRQPNDIFPKLNYECQICDEAKYELEFTGVWSRNTHPQQYPENDRVVKYSDLVGASHSTDYVLWTPGTLATPGLKYLAEHANSSQLKAEIREKIGDGVRSIIKSKGHDYLKMGNPTYAYLRVDKVNHLISIATAIHPSPDWFLGVTRFELCQEDNTWLPEQELNLYPWDAGTDSGVSYESKNIATHPQDAVEPVKMSSDDKNSPFYKTDMNDLHPFGKLSIRLIRTYQRECEESLEENETTEVKNEERQKEEENGSQPDESDSETPIVTDPDSPEDCPMSQWAEWSTCDGDCVDSQLSGYRWRERYHLVDGEAVEKYDPDASIFFVTT